MSQTNEQKAATRSLKAIAGPYRVTLDEEGWPLIKGKLGHIEYHDGVLVAAYTDRPRVFSRLLSLPLVEKHQTGDSELRVLIPARTLTLAGERLKSRRRRVLSPSSLESLRLARGKTQFKKGSD